MNVTLNKQEISDITISLETLMEQLYDDMQDYNDDADKVKYYRLWDLRNKLK